MHINLFSPSFFNISPSFRFGTKSSASVQIRSEYNCVLFCSDQATLSAAALFTLCMLCLPLPLSDQQQRLRPPPLPRKHQMRRRRPKSRSSIWSPTRTPTIVRLISSVDTATARANTLAEVLEVTSTWGGPLNARENKMKQTHPQTTVQYPDGGDIL